MISAVASILVPFIPNFIKMAEAIFKKEKSGADRLNVILNQLRAIIDKKIAQGELPNTQPSDDSLIALIEGEFQKMKLNGTLTTDMISSGGRLFIVRGNVTEIS